jgi:predicted transcriptional regulator
MVKRSEDELKMLTDLKKSIKRPESVERMEKEKVPVSILMNQTRQNILQFLFRYPCTHLHGIARNFNYSVNSTRWHLRKLFEFGYIDIFSVGNKKVYFPNEALSDQDIFLLSILNDHKMEQLYMEIKHHPGITQKEIYENLNKKQPTIVDNLFILENNELIYSQRDGLYRRYYPTGLIDQREKILRKSLKEYRRILIQLLKKDGVEPEILRTTDKKFHIRIKSGKYLADLIFHFNPYERFMN